MFYAPKLGMYLIVPGAAIKPGSLEPGRNGLGERTGNEVREISHWNFLSGREGAMTMTVLSWGHRCTLECGWL